MAVKLDLTMTPVDKFENAGFRRHWRWFRHFEGGRVWAIMWDEVGEHHPLQPTSRGGLEILRAPWN